MISAGYTWSSGRGGLNSRVKQKEALPFFTIFLPFGISPPLTACQYPAHPSRLSPHTLSHGTILDWLLPAGSLRPCLHLSFLLKDPSYSAPSFVYVHAASLSSWGVRSVHQALGWTLMLIISNPHNKLTGSTGPISQMRKQTKQGHITGLKRVSW